MYRRSGRVADTILFKNVIARIKAIKNQKNEYVKV